MSSCFDHTPSLMSSALFQLGFSKSGAKYFHAMLLETEASTPNYTSRVVMVGAQADCDEISSESTDRSADDPIGVGDRYTRMLTLVLFSEFHWMTNTLDDRKFQECVFVRVSISIQEVPYDVVLHHPAVRKL